MGLAQARPNYTHVRDNVVMPASREAEFWTSANSEPYITLIVHFIDKGWSLQSFCLETVPIVADHTWAEHC